MCKIKNCVISLYEKMENLSEIQNFKNSPSIKGKVSVCFASSYKALLMEKTPPSLILFAV